MKTGSQYPDRTKRMDRRTFLRTSAAALGALAATRMAGAARQTKPNIILMMADDMGYRDPSCYGNGRVHTPNLDRIAREGARCTQWYAASAVCTPTRASVLTGRYPLRFDIRQHFTDQGEFLPSTTTLPKLLRATGYRTAHVGKWHLGGLRETDFSRRATVPGPREHGFGHYLCQREEQPLRGQMGRERMLYREGGTCLVRNDELASEDDPYYGMYLTDIWGEEACRVIREGHASNQPFFLNLWWLTPHTPYEPAPEPHWSGTEHPGISDDQHRFRSMVARMDHQVGRILGLLDELGIADNTLVVFTSDNGGAWEANIGALKGGKTDVHEGGIRVPCMVRWPGRIPAGRIWEGLGHSNDLLPTLCAAAGLDTPGNVDGINVLPAWTGARAELARGDVFWQIHLYKNLQRHTPKPKPFATEVVRRGGWKLLARDGTPVELYDVEKDLGERHNVLDAHPELAESMRASLAAWLDAPRTLFGRAE